MENKSDIRSMFKDAMILFAITLAAGLVLGFVYELTKEPIRIQEEKAIRKACQAVFEQAEKFEEKEYAPGEALAEELNQNGVLIGTVYDAFDKAGAHLGFVLEVTSKEGYGGNITLYMGVTDSGILNGISILDISETAGLGMRAEEVLVPQFKNKQASRFSYTKSGSRSDSEIDAISGATITTKAVTNAVNGGLDVVSQLIAGSQNVNAEGEKGGEGNE